MTDRKTRARASGAAGSTGRYRSQIVIDPCHVLCFVAPAVLAFAWPWVALVFFVVLEAVAMGVLPHLRFVQRGLDARFRDRLRDQSALERTAMVAQMSEEHRRDFGELEQIVSNLKIRMDLSPDRGDVWGLDDLSELYLRLALAHRTAKDALARAGSLAAEDDVKRAMARHLEADDEGDDIEASLARRLDVLRLRANARRRARTTQRALEMDLATVSDAIRWMSEHSASAGAEIPRSLVWSRLESARINADSVHELCSLGSDQTFGDLVPRSFCDASVALPPKATQTRVAEAVGCSPPGDRPDEEYTSEAVLRDALRIA